MSRIIIQGKLPEEEEFQYKCAHCQTIFAFTRKEARPESTCRNEDYLVISCPFCKRDCYKQIN